VGDDDGMIVEGATDGGADVVEVGGKAGAKLGTSDRRAVGRVDG